MHYRNIHNESYIACYENGDVKVQGIDGSTNIFVKKGDVELHISKISQESRILVEEGDITIKMIDTHPVKITIDATEIYPGKVVKKSISKSRLMGSKSIKKGDTALIR